MEQEISFERIPTHIYSDSDLASKSVAKYPPLPLGVAIGVPAEWKDRSTVSVMGT